MRSPRTLLVFALLGGCTRLPAGPLPPLRALEAYPVGTSIGMQVALQDPERLTDGGILLPPKVFFLLTLLDGKKSGEELEQAYRERFGESIDPGALRGVVEALDRGGFLESAAFRERLRRAREAFGASPVRPAAHAGVSYPAEATALTARLRELFLAPGGPGRLPQAGPGDAPRAVVAPHIDLRVGGNTIAWAYEALGRGRPPDLAVILGTAHEPTSSFIVLTRKDYETPLGRVETDQDAVTRLAKAYGPESLADDFPHRNEHSVEFQVVFLQGTYPGRKLRIVPVLVGSLDPWVLHGSSPKDDPALERFVEELRRILAETPGRAVLIAGGDLAHVGPKFQDRDPVTPAVLDDLRTRDAKTLRAIARGDAEGFYRSIADEGDRRKVCGLGPIYVLLRATGPARGRVLRYDQWDEAGTRSAVTFGSVALDPSSPPLVRAAH